MSDGADSTAWALQIYNYWKDRIQNWQPVLYQTNYPVVLVKAGETCPLCKKTIALGEMHIAGSCVSVTFDRAAAGEDRSEGGQT